jgi:hypothetical protein
LLQTPDTDNLIDASCDPKQCRIYLTGGRGAHVEVPWEIFIAKPPKQGIERLPLIYKELAYELYVDTLDLRVYSARKGRMWRTPGVQRENGKYKVPVTVEEAMDMTVERYAELCSAPREAVPIEAPTLSQKFAVLYAKAVAKFDSAMKKRKGKKPQAELLTRFKGQYPRRRLD